MATLKLRVTTGINTQTLVRDYERTVSAKYPTVQSIADLITSILAGCQRTPSINVSVEESEAIASGTFTLTSVVATDVVTINGVSFTCVANGATGNQFNVGVDDAATAVNLAAAINGSVTALVAGYVRAVALANVVTVHSLFPGLAGNQTLIASADGTIVASGSRLTGGAADANAKTYSF